MKKRYDGADHHHLPLPPHDIMMIVANIVPIRGGGVVDRDPVLHLPVIATVTVTIAMPEENIPKNQNEKVKAKVVKNGVDHLAKNGRANIKAAEVMTVEKKRRRKRSQNEVIIGRLNHHAPTAAVMMTIQT